MSLIPGNTGTTTKAVDGIEGATAGSAVSLPSGFSGPSQRPFAAADANLTMTVATHGGLVTMTPTVARTITLPSTSVYTGYSVEVINLSTTQVITVNASAGGLVGSVPANSTRVFVSTATAPTLPGQWVVVSQSVSARAVVGDTTGTTVPDGYIGETKLATRTSPVTQASPAFGSWYDITGLSITLTPGVWEIETQGPIDAVWSSGVGYACPMMAIRTGSTVISASVGPFIGDPTGSIKPPSFNITSIRVKAIVNVSATTTYKASMGIANYAGSATYSQVEARGDLTGAPRELWIEAVRIA